METINNWQELTAEEIHEALGNVPLTTKKSILDYIDQIKKMSKEILSEEQLEEVYLFIDEKINDMGQIVKVNTLAYLKNELKNKLGKYAGSNRSEDNAFLRFYKETYKNHIKTKEYTWAMMDLSKLQDVSVLETLKTINTYALRNKLTKEEKDDIWSMLKRMVDTQNLRIINQVRSMEGIRKAFKIKIVKKDYRFCIIEIK